MRWPSECGTSRADRGAVELQRVTSTTRQIGRLGRRAPDDDDAPAGDGDQHLVLALGGHPAHARDDGDEVLLGREQVEQAILLQLEIGDPPVRWPPIPFCCHLGTRAHDDSVPMCGCDRLDRLAPEIRWIICRPNRVDRIGETPCCPLTMTEPSSFNHPYALHGRQDVVDAIAGLAAGAAVGDGGALTVVGEAGIGKTAVVDEAAAIIAVDQPDCRILRLAGVEAEVELAWSGLAELLDGVLAGIDRLAPARASAVRAALAMEGVDQPVEPFAIALATRDLLVDAAEEAPIVIVVDDLQWVDLPTRRTLSYIARRLQFERLVIVSTRRAGTTATPTPGRSSCSTRCPTTSPTRSSAMPA